MPSMALNQEQSNRLQALCHKLSATAAYLFGSAAQGEPGPLSDLDFGLLLEAPHTPASHHERRMEATAELMHLFHRSRVDVVILNEAPPLLRFRVIQQGRVLFDQNPQKRVAFEARAIQSFCDTQPLRKRYDQALLKDLRSGQFYGG